MLGGACAGTPAEPKTVVIVELLLLATVLLATEPAETTFQSTFSFTHTLFHSTFFHWKSSDSIFKNHLEIITKYTRLNINQRMSFLKEILQNQELIQTFLTLSSY